MKAKLSGTVLVLKIVIPQLVLILFFLCVTIHVIFQDLAALSCDAVYLLYVYKLALSSEIVGERHNINVACCWCFQERIPRVARLLLKCLQMW